MGALLLIALAAAAAPDDEPEGAPEAEPAPGTEPVDLDEAVPDAAPGAVARRKGGSALPAPARWAAVEAGATVPLGDFGLGGLGRVELGARLPAWEGRVQPFVAVGYAVAAASEEIVQTSDAEPWTWTLVDHQATVAAGASIRVLPASAPLSAEVALAPELVLARTTMALATADGLPGGRHAEGDVRPAGTAAVGVVARLPAGELIARGGVRVVRYDGSFTGDATGAALALTVGWRRAL